jgi:hypothetical protein
MKKIQGNFDFIMIMMFSFYFLLLQVSNPVPLAIQSTPQSASASEANAVSETKPSISQWLILCRVFGKKLWSFWYKNLLFHKVKHS